MFKPRECCKCFQLIETPGELTVFRGCPVHVACMSSRRYSEDQARKRGNEALKLFREYELEHPKEFAYQLLDLNGTDGGSHRGLAHRTKVDRFVSEVVSFKRSTLRKPTIYLAERAFKVWFKREMGYSEEEAQAQWTTDHKTLKHRLEDGVVKLPVKGHTVLLDDTGVEAKVTRIKNVDEDEFQAGVADLGMKAIRDFKKGEGVEVAKQKRRRKSSSSKTSSRSSTSISRVIKRKKSKKSRKLPRHGRADPQLAVAVSRGRSGSR